MIGMQLIFVTIAVETCVIETAQAVDQFLKEKQVFLLHFAHLFVTLRHILKRYKENPF